MDLNDSKLSAIAIKDLKPEDVIVLKIPIVIPIKCEERLRKQMREIFPNNKCIVLTDYIGIEIIRPKSDEES